MPLGSLLAYIFNCKQMRWKDRYQIMTDIVEGMTFLHSKTNPDGIAKPGVFHQDFKMEMYYCARILANFEQK